MPIDWKTLRRDPRYKKLSYSEQLNVNAQLAAAQLKNDQRFQQLDPSSKQATLNAIARQKPVYENPDQEVAEIEQLAEAAQQDEQVADQAIDKIGWRAFREQMTILDMIEGAVGYTAQFLDPGSFDYQRIKQQNQRETRDKEKAYQYLEQSINSELDKAKAIQRHKTVGQIGGFITDFAAWWGATAPAASALKGLTAASKLGQRTGMFAAKMSGKGSAITSSGKRWFYQSLVPEIAQDVRGGLIGVARENINGTIEERMKEDPEWYDAAWENTKTFGEYFLGDMLFFSGLQAAKVMGKAGRGIYGRSWVKKAPREMISDDEFQEVLGQMIKQQGLSRETIASLPREAQEEMRRVALGMARAKNVTNLKDKPQELMQYWLRGKNYDVYQEGNKWFSKEISTGKMMEADTFNDIVKQSIDAGNLKMKPSFKDPAQAAEYMGGSSDMQIQQVIRANTSGLNIDEYGMAQLLKPDSVGSINRKNVNFVGNEIMKKTGVGVDQIKQVKYRQVDDYFNRPKTSEGDVIFVPKQITEPAQEAKFVQNLTNDLKRVTESKGGSFQNYTDIGEQILRVKERAGFSPHWVEYAAKKYTDGDIVRVGEKLELRTRNGVEAVGNMEDIGQHLFKNYAFADSNIDILEHTQNFLAHERGMKLATRQDGTLVLNFRDNKGKMVKRHYQNLQELWNDQPNTIPKLPTSSMPDINIVDSKLNRFEIREGIAAGNPKQMTDFMKSFKDYKTLGETLSLKTSKGNIVNFNKKYRTYQVTEPETGVTRTFKKMDDAKQFVDSGIKTFKDVDAAARFKGARVTPFKGEYLIYQKGTDTPLIAQTLDDAKKHIRNLEQPDYIGKELMDLDPQAISELQTKFRDAMPDSAFEAEYHEMADRIIQHARRTGGKVSGVSAFVDRIAPKDMTISRMAKEAGMPEVYDLWRNLEKGRQRAEGAYAAWSKDFQRSVGKLSREQDEALGSILLEGAPQEKWNKIFRDHTGRDITQKDIKILDRVRDILGRSPEEGLFSVFNIDSYKFLTEYFPRIRKKLRELDGVNLGSNNAGTVIRKHLGYKELPKEVAFFAENMRADDLLRFSAKESLQDVLSTYVRAGYNRVHMDGPWRKAVNFVDQTRKKKGDQMILNEMSGYLEQLKGLESTAEKRLLEEGTKDLTYKIFKKMDKVMGTNRADKVFTDDLVTLGNKFTIASTMSFRAWLPIRNSFQPFFTLAPRVGNDVVMEAMKRAAQNGEEIVNRLKRQGRIPDKAPIMELVGGNNSMLIDKFNNKGMFWYQNSDAWTRGVVDQAADVLMGDAAQRYAKGWINEKEFVSLSKIDALDELKQKEILDHLRGGNYELAKDTFADHLTWETMFPYKAGTNPTMFTGTMGRIFGGFGHYPVYYTSNLVRGLKNSKGVGKKINFAAHVVGNSLAIYNVFNEVLGIDAKAFLFTSPMSFSGGPYYDLLNTALEATNTTYYTGAIARQKLPETMSRLFLPGSSLWRSGMDALKQLDKGNTHGFIVNAMSAPLNENF